MTNNPTALKRVKTGRGENLSTLIQVVKAYPTLHPLKHKAIKRLTHVLESSGDHSTGFVLVGALTLRDLEALTNLPYHSTIQVETLVSERPTPLSKKVSGKENKADGNRS